MTKRIIKFIAFKAVELIAAFMVWWGLSWLGYVMDYILRGILKHTIFWHKWFAAPLFGLSGIGLLFICGMLIYLIYRGIKWNWEKAK